MSGVRDMFISASPPSVKPERRTLSSSSTASSPQSESSAVITKTFVVTVQRNDSARGPCAVSVSFVWRTSTPCFSATPRAS